VVTPVTGGGEEDQQEEGAVDARAVEEVGAEEEKENEYRGCIGRDEEKREPAGGERASAWTLSLWRRGKMEGQREGCVFIVVLQETGRRQKVIQLPTYLLKQNIAATVAV
jgi:hypothetical protein